MNDLPENELFSAHLDGELNAAEQAEMERLLAASPAARQLLDELRALSATLQSLPHEKLGDDLGPQVLRVAERRMLTGQEHGDAKGAPVPLVRSVFHRLLNRRSLAWAGLAAAICVMISMNEWRQQSGPIAQVAKEVALATPAAANNRMVRKTDRQPAIQAVPDQKDVFLRNESLTPVEEESQKARTADMPASAPAPASFGAAARAPVERSMDRNRKMVAAPKREELPEGKSMEAEGILVIRCNISAKAAQRRPLEKLLDANGMTWREQTDRKRIEDKTREDAKAKGGEKASPQSNVSNEVNLVWVVATPAQVDATLAGLSAQPDVFLTHSVNPPSSELPEDVVQQFLATGRTLRQLVPGGGLFQFEQRTHVAGPTTEPGAVGQLDMEVREQMRQPTKVGKRQDAMESVEEKPPTDGPLKPQPLAESAPLQRVLFVLQVVDQESSASTAESKSAAETAAPAAMPAKQPGKEK